MISVVNQQGQQAAEVSQPRERGVLLAQDEWRKWLSPEALEHFKNKYRKEDQE